LSGVKGSGAVGSQQHKADATFHSAFLPPEPSIGSSHIRYLAHCHHARCISLSKPIVQRRRLRLRHKRAIA
jgi:hypothetical protein